MRPLNVLFSLMSMLISLYISYSLLKAINADRLLWFLFWANIPFYVIVLITRDILEREAKANRR